MSNSNVISLKDGTMNTLNIELPSINCKECGAENSLSEALSAGIIDTLMVNATKNVEIEFEQRLIAERDQFQKDAKAEAKRLSDEQLKSMSQELADLSTAKTNLEIEKAKAEANQASLQKTMEAQIQLAATAAVDKARAEFALTENEQKVEIERLKKSIEGLKSSTSAVSPELLGESGEFFVEDLIPALFPQDLVEEIKRGQSGADCLWSIRKNGGGVTGKIYIESKVTQSFQSSWLQKLRDDMVEKGATVGIIVTKSMPKDQLSCGLRDGIWVCTFHELGTLAKAIRQAQIELSRALSQEAVKEGLSNELFDFVVGREFSAIMDKILRPIFEQQQILDRENGL